jgi:nucleotide-binding universal stress UspA family protein
MTTSRSIRRWLLAIDGSLNANRAVDYVARWAHAFGVTEVYVLNVQPLGSYRAYALHRNETLLEASERGTQATAVARQVLDDAKIAYRFHTELGESADAIVGAARSEHVAEIFLGSRGLGAFANLALGSVAYKVIHLAEVPVTVVTNPHEEPHLLAAGPDNVHRVLLAVDGSDHADRAVHYVCRLADGGIPIEAALVNVQLPVLSGRFQGLVSQETIDSHYREEGEAALRRAQRALTKANIRFDSEVLMGPLAPTIVRMAEKRHCARIVMGTRGLGAIGSVVLGSVAYKVVHLAAVPVTLIK